MNIGRVFCGSCQFLQSLQLSRFPVGHRETLRDPPEVAGGHVWYDTSTLIL